MLTLVALVVFVAMAIQFPLAYFVYRDATRRNIVNAEMYPLGLLVLPMFGLVVFAWYRFNRDELPRRDSTETSVRESNVYRVQLRGFLNLPTRIACVFLAYPWILWIVLVLTPVLLAGGVFIAPEIGGLYTALVVFFLFLVIPGSYRYHDTRVTIDNANQTLTQSVGSGHGTVFWRADDEITLSNVTAVSYRRFGDIVFVRLNSSKPFANRTVVVPSDRIEEFTRMLSQLGITVPEHVEMVGLSAESGVSQRRAWGYVLAGLGVGFVLPVVVFVLRPEFFIPTGGALFLAVFLLVIVGSRVLDMWRVRAVT